MKLILASASPRRRELLQMLGASFEVRPADVDETIDPRLTPTQAVAVLSERKAKAVKRDVGEIVIAADTIVVCKKMVRGKPEWLILGKPHSEEEAYEMLSMLSGREHEVMTGVTVTNGSLTRTWTEVTKVRFREITRKEKLDYIATGEPMDKAGAYGIQGGAARFCTGITGDYYNVVGLPVCRVVQMVNALAPGSI